jgi:hypothetical protein
MFEDRYGNALSTRSASAREAYVDGVDRFLAAQPDVEGAFEAAIAADDQFTLAHVGLARARQSVGKNEGAAEAITRARLHTKGLTEREAGHLHALGLLIDGNGPAAYPAIRSHLLEHRRDVMLTQTCSGVFGLIGFSGQPGREAEQLAFTTSLVPFYGDDWWFLGQHAFAQSEAGQIEPATETIERSLAGNSRNANGAHIRAHIYYEAGETDAGYEYAGKWWQDYDSKGALHCHISWHIALWALERGDTETLWEVIDTHVAPGKAWGPSLNVLSDNAAILYRAELAGVEVTPDRWQAVSSYAAKHFPNTGIAFADVHAALAHAKAGNSTALGRIIAEAKGPAADMVRKMADAFQAIATEDWGRAVERLSATIASHERIGGSRAQRDLIEYALMNALIQQGRTAEARLLHNTRRPLTTHAQVVKGL